MCLDRKTNSSAVNRAAFHRGLGASPFQSSRTSLKKKKKKRIILGFFQVSFFKWNFRKMRVFKEHELDMASCRQHAIWLRQLCLPCMAALHDRCCSVCSMQECFLQQSFDWLCYTLVLHLPCCIWSVSHGDLWNILQFITSTVLIVKKPMPFWRSYEKALKQLLSFKVLCWQAH